MSSTRQKIPVLDAFRFVAAFSVAIVHYEIVFGTTLLNGYFATTAVSWFFMVSGFILSYTYPELTRSADLRRFYLHRVIRIYPVYFLAVMVSALFIVSAYASHGEGLFTLINRPFEISYDLPEEKSGRFWFGATLRHLVFLQSLHPMETLKLVFNGPLWSLVLEMYFYLVFPLLLLLLRPVKTRVAIFVTLLALYVLQFLLIQLNLPEAESYNIMNLNVPVYTNPFIRGIEFLMGMLLFKLFDLAPVKEKMTRSALWQAVISVAIFSGVILWVTPHVPYQYSAFFLEVPLVGYMVWTFLQLHWYPGDAAVRNCALLGGMSYVLYCFHWPVMEMLKYSQWWPDTAPGPIHVFMVVCVLLLASFAIYRFVESPMRRLLYRRFG